VWLARATIALATSISGPATTTLSLNAFPDHTQVAAGVTLTLGGGLNVVGGGAVTGAGAVVLGTCVLGSGVSVTTGVVSGPATTLTLTLTAPFTLPALIGYVPHPHTLPLYRHTSLLCTTLHPHTTYNIARRALRPVSQT
jgi:hypothetical protein